MTTTVRPAASRGDQRQNKIQNFERSTTMSYYQEGTVRATVHERLDQAESQRRARQLVAARRLSRKAERAAAQARLALARII